MKKFWLLFMLFAIFSCAKDESSIVHKTSKSHTLQSEISCKEFKRSLPKDWFQNTMTLPENPQDPQGYKIKIFYYGKIIGSATPVVFFNGGPSLDSHNSSELLMAWLKQHDASNDISFVFIDQRGNGCSDPYPQGRDEKILSRLQFYGSRGIVFDAENIRKQLLGNKRWVAFGQSYGGTIVQRYLIEHPNSLLSAVVHGQAIMSDSYLRFKQRIISQMFVKAQYLEKYPEDASIFKGLHETAQLSECVTDPKKANRKFCGFSAISDIIQLMAWRLNWEYLHDWVQSLTWSDDPGINWDAVIEFARSQMGYPDKSNDKYLARRVIAWIERNILVQTFENCKRVERDLLDKEIALRDDALNECAPSLQAETTSFENFQAPLIKDNLSIKQLKSVLIAYPSLHYYSFSSALDPLIPSDNFQEEKSSLEDLSNFHYSVLDHSGHDGFYTELKILEVLKSIKEKILMNLISPSLLIIAKQ